MEKFFWQIYACVYDLILGHFSPYLRIIEKTMSEILPKKGGRYLDIGCGTGNFIAEILLRNKDATVVGVDFSPAMIKRAREKVSIFKSETELLIADFNERLPFENSIFDYVICSNVLYTAKKPLYLLKELFRVIKEEGRLVLTTPLHKPKMLPVIREHVDHLAKKHGQLRYLVFAVQLISVLFPLIYFIILNEAIRKNKACNFFRKIELESILKQAGFIVLKIELVYGDQNWFVIVEK